jgi:hypothetical protein
MRGTYRMIGAPQTLQQFSRKGNDDNSSCASVKSWVSQLCLALNPCWQSVKIWWASRCLRILLTIICSRVPHERLLKKLDHYGIRDSTQGWIKAFLSNRTQQVIVEGATSDTVPVISGVPQGTVLGPTSNDDNSSCASVKSWVSQLRLALNPCWQSVKIWWAYRCLRILLTIICSCTEFKHFSRNWTLKKHVGLTKYQQESWETLQML